MSLTRQTQKVFASNANANQLAVFGSMKTGTPVYSTSLSTLQSTAYTEGWSEALLNDKAPYMEEMNAVQYGLSYQIAYLLQEGVGAYDANTNYSDTSIVKTIENGKLFFYRSLSDNNLGHALNNTTYWEKISISDTRNIGEIVTSTIPLLDAGLHLLDGSLLSGSGSYSSFVSFIAGLYTATPTANYFCTEAQWQASVTQYGVCGKFVYDSVNNTVRLPKVTGFIEGAGAASTLGNLTGAGLPNITGHFISVDDNRTNQEYVTGAFYVDNNRIGTDGGGTEDAGISFDASRSSSIYGNSSTVQPQSVKVLYYIVIATTEKTSIEVDIDEIATDLNGKADTDLSNTDDTAKILMSGMAMPSTTYDNLTLGASETSYTAPANGWVQFNHRVSNSNDYITLINDTSGIMSMSRNVNADGLCRCFIPCAKNDIFHPSYNSSSSDTSSNLFRFIYAQGSESEGS